MENDININNNNYYLPSNNDVEFSSLKDSKVERFCSWCEKVQFHQLVRTRMIMKWERKEYRCVCHKETVYCRKWIVGCNGMARSHGHKSEELCYQCKPDSVANEKNVEGRCSWCDQHCGHHLEENNFVVRSVYRCSNCDNRTLKCKNAENCSGMARGHPLYDDNHCYPCLQIHEERKMVNRWCSYCAKQSTHTILENNHFKLRRDVYSCSNCLQRTLKCIKCERAMTCGGTWDEFICVFCQPVFNPNNKFGKNAAYLTEEQKWEHFDNIREEMSEKYPQKEMEWRIKQLERDSKEKKKAFECGMIEPFFCLVTMTPMERIQIAASLGFTLVFDDHFRVSNENYVHEEAWKIIDYNLMGLQARTHKTREKLNPFASGSTWYQCLARTCSMNFKICKSSRFSYSKELSISKHLETELEEIKKEWLEKLWFCKTDSMTSKSIEDANIILKSRYGTLCSYQLAYHFDKYTLEILESVKKTLKQPDVQQKIVDTVSLIKGTVSHGAKLMGANVAVDEIALEVLSDVDFTGLLKNVLSTTVDIQNAIVGQISKLIARAIVSLQSHGAVYSVAEISTLIIGLINPIVNIFFAVMFAYQLLTFAIGSSPERLLFAIQKILFHDIYLKEQQIDLKKYLPKN